MSKTLVIAEKPSVGRDLARVLPGPFAKHEGWLEGPEHVITWAVGHLVQLAEPDEYDPKYKRWRMADLPIVPPRFRLVVRDERSRKQFSVVRTQLHRDDIDEVVNACDAGREGELIFAYLYEQAKATKSVRRLWLSSMTQGAIKTAFSRLRPADELHPLEEAARSRSEADWIVGMNATRAATIRLRSSFDGAVSLGRVQTPTLAIVARRETEIRAFKPEPYWLVEATFAAEGSEPRQPDGEEASDGARGRSERAGLAERVYVGRYHAQGRGAAGNGASRAADDASDVADGGNGTAPPEQARGPRIATEQEALRIVEACRERQGLITKVERRRQREQAPLLYDLTSLQREANTRYGYSAKRTLAAAQRLYEEHKALTYPRTNSRYLGSDMVAEIKPIAGLVGAASDYANAAAYVTSLDLLPLGRVINDAKVSDHHAIIPTRSEHRLEKMGPDERRIYDMVARRFLAVFHPDAELEATRIETTVSGHLFRTTGRVLVVPGWRAVYGELSDAERAKAGPAAGQTAASAGDQTGAREKDRSNAGRAAPADDDEGGQQQLPRLLEGEQVQTRKVESLRKETKPPRRYSDASLLAAMETAGKLVDDEELREAMKESGIGTPATRAAIIERLIEVGYLERQARALVPTEKGINVVALLDRHELTSPHLTGQWEHRLGKIEQGEDSRKVFMSDIARFARETVSELDDKLNGARIPRANLGPCPVCGRDIIENRKGYSCWSREDPGCGFVIWKSKVGKQLPASVARELIRTGYTAQQVTGFRNRSGRSFRARLALSQTEDGKWRVEFDEPWAREGVKPPEEGEGDTAAREAAFAARSAA